MSTFLTEVKGFTPLIEALVQEVGLVQAAVYGVVWRYCQGQEGICRASQDTIGKALGIHRSTVQRHISELCEAGYLEDTTPDLCNRPHIYRDTGKAKIIGLVQSKTTVAENDTTVAENDTPLSQKTTRREYKSTEDSIIDSNESIADADAVKEKDKPKSPLEPDVWQSEEMFDKLRANARAKNRRGPLRFPTLETKQKFDDAVNLLNREDFNKSLTAALEQGITSVKGVTNYISAWAKRTQSSGRVSW